MATSKIKTSSPRLMVQATTGGSGSTPANGNRTASVNIAKSGYTPIGIVGASTLHGSILLQEFSLANSTTASVIVRSLIGSAYTHSVTVWVLYVQN